MSEPQHRFGPFAPAVNPEHARIRMALIDAALREGVQAVGVQGLCAKAGVEPQAFRSEFGSVAECATEVYLANIAEFDRVVFGTVERASGWPARLRAGAYAAARYIRERPRESHFDFVEMLEAGETAQAYRDRYVRRLVALIEEGRAVAPDPEALTPGIGEATLGSIYEVAARSAGEAKGFAEAESLVPELMYIAVRPYLGHETALRELEIPPPAETAGAPR